jgi:ABC-type uncharacterized transport system substrate-binding protein
MIDFGFKLLKNKVYSSSALLEQVIRTLHQLISSQRLVIDYLTKSTKNAVSLVELLKQSLQSSNMEI